MARRWSCPETNCVNKTVQLVSNFIFLSISIGHFKKGSRYGWLWRFKRALQYGPTNTCLD